MGAMPPLTDGSQVMWLGVAVVEVAGDRADSRSTDRNGRGVVWVGEGVAVGGIGGVVVGDVAGATLGSDASLLRGRPQRLGKGATTLGGGGGVGAGVGVATDVGTTLEVVGVSIRETVLAPPSEVGAVTVYGVLWVPGPDVGCVV
jgi:hypothetical protein